MKDLIIIGGGPAGCSAAIYATRRYLDTLLITDDFTGQLGLSSTVENYLGFKNISGLDLAKKFKDHLLDYDIEINSFEKVREIKKQNNSFLVITDEGEYESRTLLLCMGASPRKLNVINEEKFQGKGISYCVTCDGLKYKSKNVVVVGGGNAGLEAVLELRSYVKKIYLLEKLNRLTADEILIKKVKELNNVEILTEVEVRRFEGKERLEKIFYKQKEQVNEQEILIDGCFVQIGCIPNTEIVENIVKLNSKGEVVVNPKTFQTSQKGIYAAGDIVDFNLKQIVVATAQGALASTSAYRYLKGLDTD